MPPSVRFWDRRVYWAPVILLVSALRQKCSSGMSFKKLKAFLGVCRSTVKRWQHYFQELFPESINYRRLSGQLIPPLDAHGLPGALLDRFLETFVKPEAALAVCLRTLAHGP